MVTLATSLEENVAHVPPAATSTRAERARRDIAKVVRHSALDEVNLNGPRSNIPGKLDRYMYRPSTFQILADTGCYWMFVSQQRGKACNGVRPHLEKPIL